MPLTGAYSWKDVDLSLEERINRFFNLIDHAVEGGVPLEQLYSREHVKKFLYYAIQHAKLTRTSTLYSLKDLRMPKLTLTSTFASAVIVGDPGTLTLTLGAKETRTIEVTDVQLRQLLPQLEKLKTAKWLDYAVSEDAVVSAPVQVVEVVKVEEVKVEETKTEPTPVEVAPVVPATPIATETAVVTETPVVPKTPAELPAKTEEVVAKTNPFEKKNRNR